MSGNAYTKAVDYIEEVTNAYGEACDLAQLELPNIESGIVYALQVLKSHQDYDGQNPGILKQ